MGDFERLLGGKEFGGCFCAVWTSHDETWEDRCQNRKSENLELTRSRVRRREHVGYLVSRELDGAIVGWTGSGPKTGFTRLKAWPGTRMGPQDDSVWVVGCLAIGFAYRGLGYSQQIVELLEAEAKAAGAAALEAYPADPVDDADAWRGSRKLFESVGFKVEGEETVGGKKFLRMVKPLA
jgi:GNAT superfamily N-acetyltransferase